MESKQHPSSWTPAATALCGALVVFSGCGHAASDPAKAGEGTERASSAEARSFGSSDQPNDCGSYMGDASFPEGHAGGPASFTGHITSAGSPAQNGWFGPPLVGAQGDYNAHSCDTPNPTPTVRDQARDNHYNEIFLRNWTDADACISVWGFHNEHLDAYEGWQIGAYVGAFDPNDIVKNNVAACGGGVAHFSFKVPAKAAFEIVVMAEAPHASDPDPTQYAPVDVNWSINVANCGQPGDAGTSSGGMSSSGGTSSGGGGMSSSGGSSSGGDTDAGSPPPTTDDAGTGGKSW